MAPTGHRPHAHLVRLIAVIHWFSVRYVFLNSFKPPSEIVHVPPSFLPERRTLQSYLGIFNDPRVALARFNANSLFVAVSRVLITLFTSSSASSRGWRHGTATSGR
jgi:ABC-type glycerol-3-phosphate transport system permease component